jgi:Ankyrin repeats (many copies)
LKKNYTSTYIIIMSLPPTTPQGFRRRKRTPDGVVTFHRPRPRVDRSSLAYKALQAKRRELRSMDEQLQELLDRTTDTTIVDNARKVADNIRHVTASPPSAVVENEFVQLAHQVTTEVKSLQEDPDALKRDARSAGISLDSDSSADILAKAPPPSALNKMSLPELTHSKQFFQVRQCLESWSSSSRKALSWTEGGAADSCTVSIMDKLNECGGPSNAPALSYAIMHGQLDLVKYLLKFYPNIAQCDRNGETAWHYAVKHRQSQCTPLLRTVGGVGPAHIANKAGLSAVQLATKMGLSLSQYSLDGEQDDADADADADAGVPSLPISTSSTPDVNMMLLMTMQQMLDTRKEIEQLKKQATLGTDVSGSASAAASSAADKRSCGAKLCSVFKYVFFSIATVAVVAVIGFLLYETMMVGVEERRQQAIQDKAEAHQLYEKYCIVKNMDSVRSMTVRLSYNVNKDGHVIDDPTCKNYMIKMNIDPEKFARADLPMLAEKLALTMNTFVSNLSAKSWTMLVVFREGMDNVLQHAKGLLTMIPGVGTLRAILV